MPVNSRTWMPRGARIALLIAGVVGLATGVLGWVQVQRERAIDEEDLDRRAHAFAHQMAWFVRNALAQPDADVASSLGDRMDGHRRVIGFAVFRPDGRMVASGEGVSEFSEELRPRVLQALETGEQAVEAVRLSDSLIHVLVRCIKDADGSVLGVLAVLHDMSFVEQRATARFVQFGFWILLVSLLLVALIAAATWAAYDRPLGSLADWMRRLRTENVPEAPPRGLPTALLASESDRLAASFRAARSTGWSESHETVREHNAWTRERLRTHAIDCLQDRQLIVVSNREPYMHQFRDGSPHMIIPAGGLVTALDPVLQACGGLWIAHGAGDADRQTADASGRLTVPPSDARYTLRRVWLSREEEQGYYYGLSNEGLWPLCHLAHERPTFRAADWRHYCASTSDSPRPCSRRSVRAGPRCWFRTTNLRCFLRC
ncbi:MAG TPA: trehalose-6-phosphate synthase [Phycisphaerae bacterium]|nr:trehalose-6-phosphate synthase [Phycisphaerae bacterium]